MEPKNVGESLKDESWVVAMQEDLNQFTSNDVSELVPNPKSMRVIGTKWEFLNKLDENGVVSRNKDILVTQGYNQQEGIDYDETYAPTARLESIRILLAYAYALYFKLFQMDKKSEFLNGFINEEVYMAQTSGFINFKKPNDVYKLKKALYGLNKLLKLGSLNDKILVSESNSSPCCARCGTPVDGPSCRGCAFLRKKFDEDLLAYCVENFQNNSESPNDNTNVVNALREPCVVNQDPGEKSSQEPPQIDHNCCYKCGDSLDGIFCRQCICKSCGKSAHFSYNCPPKDPIISKPEPCNEIPQTLPSLDPSCFSLLHVSKPNLVDDPPNIFNLPSHTLLIVHPTCDYEAKNSFAYNPNLNSFDNSPNFSYHPPQLQFETYLCELCGNNAHYGYDCPPQFPFVYEQEPCYNQNFSDNYYPQNSPSFSQQYLCCAYCGGPHYDYQCQPINETYYEPNSSYDSSGFDQPQPPQDSVDHQGILQVLNKMEEKFEEIIRDGRKKIEDMSIEEMMHEQ
ncbi:putative reverse transcriptase domain-containing protein [Tanacetum coccineum]